MSERDEDRLRRSMVTAFDDAAADFDALSPYLWEPLAADTLAESKPCPGERVLDACCGTGASARPTAARVGAAGHVDAVDISAPMIARLRDASSGLPQLHPQVQDVDTWVGEGYHLVQSVMGIFFLPEMARSTRRLVARCRPGGRVAFTIWQRGAMVEAGRQLGRAVAAVKNEPPPPVRPRHLMDEIDTAPTFRPWLASLGLVNVSVEVKPRRLSTAPDVAWLLVTGSGFRHALSGLDPARVIEVRARYLELLHTHAPTGVDASSLVGLGTWPGPPNA